MTLSPITIQILPKSQPSTPSWMGEVATFAQILMQEGILKAIQDRVRFARARFGQYDLIDFVIVLIGYGLSAEPTLQAFYERLAPFAEPFMALFGRNQLPHRSTLSRFLAALDQPTVEALRTLFQEDLLARKPTDSPGGLFDRTGEPWMVVDVDGTRQAARQRTLRQREPCQCRIAISRQFARRAIRGRNEEKLCANVPSFTSRIRISFSARSEGQATAITEASSCVPSRSSSAMQNR